MKTGDPEPMREAYDKWHAASLDGGAAGLSDWHINALSLAPRLEGLRVLEAGCGTGAFSVELARRGAEVSAFDFSPVAVEAARALVAERLPGREIPVRVADIHDPPYEPCSFDLIFCCETLEHLADPNRALRGLADLLRPGGRLILTTENYSNAMIIYWLLAWMRRKPFNSGVHPQPVEHFFVYPMVRGMLRRAGLVPRRMAGSHHVFFAVPGLHPHTFVVERFRNRLAARLLRPFARHMAFEALKPGAEASR